MSMERKSTDTSGDQSGERFPWILPKTGVHITTLAAADVARALDVTPETAAAVIEAGHGESVTSYDDDSLRAGCGCGWYADGSRFFSRGGRPRLAAAEDFAAHLADMASKVEWFGPTAARTT